MHPREQSAPPILFRLPLHSRRICVLRFEPIGRAAGTVDGILALRDDAFEAKLAGVGEDGRAVAFHVLVEAANAQYAPAPPAYSGTGQYPPVPVSPYPSTPTYTRGGPGYGYGPGPNFVCQAVGARSVGYGRA